MVQNGAIATSYTGVTSEIRVEENQLFYSNFWSKLFGVTKIEFYSQAKPSQPSNVIDADLTRGYYHTSLIVKSRTYTNTELTSFGGVDFIGQMTAICLGFFWIFKIFVRYCLPTSTLNELDTIKHIYRVQDNNEVTSIKKFKKTINEIADRLDAQ